MKSILFILLIFLTGICFSQNNQVDPAQIQIEVQEIINNNGAVEIITPGNNSAKEQKPVTAKLPEADQLPKLDPEKVNQMINELGANNFKIRKKAKLGLTQLGFQVIPFLEKTLEKSNDPEVTENIKEIITKLTFRLNINQLNDKQKKIALLPFKKGAVSGPQAVAEYYNNNGHFVIDIGLTRIVFEEEIKEISGGFNSSVNITLEGNHGGGGSSSNNNFKIYQYSYENGTGFWAICEKSFTVSNYELEIGDKKLNLKPEQPQVLFIDKNGKSIGILDLK